VDSLEIDRSFVDGVEISARHTALVGTIVHLAQALGLPVAAEGVETTAQHDVLLAAGCRLGQGYLFSVPLAEDEVLRWLIESPVDAVAPVPLTVPAGPGATRWASGHR
jgi:EAL domain-containing protein (putative c-di-GMP-specific phosphodiesterase class I)